MSPNAWLFLLVCSAFLSGCATPLKSNQVKVTFDSEPPGAMIYSGDQAHGVAPKTLIYDLPPDAVKRGWIDDNNVRAVWPSGAVRKGVRLTMQIREGTVTFSRPSNAPGLDIDLAHAARLRQVAATEAQANAASEAANEARRARYAAEEARDAAKARDTSKSSATDGIMIINGRTCIRAGPIVDCN